MFAALNVMRREVIKRYNLPPDFELSQSYLFFWDKLERMNYNLESIIQTAGREIDDRTVATILNDPVADGGQWDMFVNLVNKYGVVPKSVFGETFHSGNSAAMNALFKTKFRQAALTIRSLVNQENGMEIARKYKDEFNEFVFSTLCKLLGTPPTNFVWEYVDKAKQYHRTNIRSPQDFLKDIVSVNLDDYVCIINDPRSGHGYYKLYTVEFLGNVVGGHPIRYLNVPIEDMQKSTLASLMDNNVVWFGCDVGKERLDEIMSLDIKEYGQLLGTTFDMTKESRLRTGESQMTHAMVFSGFNAINVGEQLVVTRWEVENSWGKKPETNGYYIMTDAWFREYMYEVVIHKKYATQQMLDALTSEEMKVLPLWDPMGALA
jgi:bleomycin hydrolase